MKSAATTGADEERKKKMKKVQSLCTFMYTCMYMYHQCTGLGY